MSIPDRFRRSSTFALIVWLSAFACIEGNAGAQAPEPVTPQPPQSAAPSTPATSAAQSSPTASSPVEIADSLVYHKRYQEAIAKYASVPRKTASVWNKMGIANQMMLNLSEAERCYKQSLLLEPRDPSVVNNLGTVYESQHSYGQAEKMYHKAIKLDPKFALAYKNLASSLMAQRKFKKGREADARALALDPAIFQPGEHFTVDNPASARDRGAMNYYMAIDCALAGQTTCALEHLRMALNQGYTNPAKVAADSNFAALSGDPRFQQLLAEESGNKAGKQGSAH
jgi:tetratricopeptide (TPR) repeat protein